MLPGPAPAPGDGPGRRYDEIPIAIQDRLFDDDGSLFYPDTRELFDGLAGPYVPDSDIAPIWNPEVFGDAIVVNGRTCSRRPSGWTSSSTSRTSPRARRSFCSTSRPDEPFGGGAPGVDLEPADPETTGQVMQLRVVPRVGVDTSLPPDRLVLPRIGPLPEATVTRQLR